MPRITFETTHCAPPDFAPAHGLRRQALDQRVGKVVLAIFCGMVSVGCFSLSLLAPLWLIPASATLFVALMALSGSGISFPRLKRVWVSSWGLPSVVHGFKNPGGARWFYSGGPAMAPRSPHFDPARAPVGFKCSGVGSKVTDPVGRPVDLPTAVRNGHAGRPVPAYPLPPTPPGRGGDIRSRRHNSVAPMSPFVLDGTPRPQEATQPQRAAVRTKSRVR